MIPDHHAVERPADAGVINVVHADNLESTFTKPFVLSERRTDLARPDDDDVPLSSEAEDIAETGRERADGVAESALPERAEEREILADLCGGSAALGGEFSARDRLMAVRLELLQEAEVGRESSDRGFCDSFHGERVLVNDFTS